MIELILIFFLYQPFKDIIKGNSELKFELTLNLNIFVYLVAIIIFLFIHELIHAIYVPNMLKSTKTYWGFNGIKYFWNIKWIYLFIMFIECRWILC
ncbi:hypothetical protein A500_16110 [Clostridium sartagoforme AAU1]|uniref:DUF3267 domain-containing protein n=1 Tax=Clostridium sartagoforme AAU1 TaxID=1202534 RepID=R9BU06_9CLOT|nr:hypothetical protein A500_16110 [Clostridium sartagoforme AAU1]